MAGDAYARRKAEVAQKPVDELSRWEMLWKMKGFPQYAMLEQDEVDAAERVDTQRKLSREEREYKRRKAEVKQQPVNQLSHEELLWKVQGFPKGSVPVQKVEIQGKRMERLNYEKIGQTLARRRRRAKGSTAQRKKTG